MITRYFKTMADNIKVVGFELNTATIEPKLWAK